MSNKGFNGSTLSFAGTAVGTLIGLTVDTSAAEVDVTASGDTVKSYESGIPDPSIQVEVIGGTVLAVGSKGSVGIAWNDGTTTGTLTKGVVTKSSVKGTKDGSIDGSYTIRYTTT